MFKNDDGKKNLRQDIETIIGHSVKLDGDFVSEGDIVVEGMVNGNVKTKNFLRIGEKAVINAEIEAGNAFIAGTINGNLKIISNLEITATAKIKGDIKTSLISIENGALINGKIEMKEENEPKNFKAKNINSEQPEINL